MKTALLSILILVACVLFPAQDAAAQKSGLHPGVDTIGTVTRAPWYNGMVAGQKTHTKATATADTFFVKGAKSTDYFFFTRTSLIADSISAWSAQRQNAPIISLLSVDTIVVNFRRADTLTYNWQLIRKQF